MNDDHIPVPAEHAPRKEMLQDGISGILVREKGSDSAWISADNPITVER